MRMSAMLNITHGIYPCHINCKTSVLANPHATAATTATATPQLLNSAQRPLISLSLNAYELWATCMPRVGENYIPFLRLETWIYSCVNLLSLSKKSICCVCARTCMHTTDTHTHVLDFIVLCYVSHTFDRVESRLEVYFCPPNVLFQRLDILLCNLYPEQQQQILRRTQTETNTM